MSSILLSDDAIKKFTLTVFNCLLTKQNLWLVIALHASRKERGVSLNVFILLGLRSLQNNEWQQGCLKVISW